MGVSGVGKSTVAEEVARRSGGIFVEADAFHPAQNIEAMSAGIPLNDDMRWHWLEALCLHVRSENCGSGESPVFIACSALKRKYRDFLRERLGPLFIIHLDGDRELILNRLQARKGHFMPPALLDSQIGDLEYPSQKEGACVRFDIAEPIDKIVSEAFSLIENEWREKPRHS
ncbi:AAA family ATPase [Stappia sp. GBMRC 2046]|uniref:Gluconokinase n=2 Tax=Stappia sediminis TaxID=2692190 RepID=A0A7X3LYI1_9HYPH|nr:AAA family ATPase [Stappia sediminis]